MTNKNFIPSLAAFALLALFRSEADLLRVRFARRHTILCGLGRKGLRLTEELAATGELVVVKCASDPIGPPGGST